MNKATTIRRLIKLADFIEKVPRKNFDIKEWYKEENCQSYACLIGWACHIPSFKKAGLKLIVKDIDDDYGDAYVLGCPKFKRFQDIDVAAMFFGITRTDAASLFYPEGYKDLVKHSYKEVTPKMAAKKIRRFIKEFAKRGKYKLVSSVTNETEVNYN